MMSDTFATEPWTYTVDGVDYEGRKVWHVPTPGPVGCGVMYHESDARVGTTRLQVGALRRPMSTTGLRTKGKPWLIGYSGYC